MIIKGDAREKLYGLKYETIALIITSPPYPMIKKWDELFDIGRRRNSYMVFQLQHESLLDPIWAHCGQLLIPGGILCINIGDATRTYNDEFMCYPNYARITMACMTLGFRPLIPILWKKISNRPNAFLGSGMLPPNAYVSQDHEYIAIFRKGGLRQFKTAQEKENRRCSQYTKEERDLWFRQVWEIPGAKNSKDTSAFPSEIPERLVRMFSVEGDRVLDPFCGTGTTIEAANKYGRIGIGITL